MYTSGITKIFMCRNEDLDLNEMQKLAVMSGYFALSYKGDIYIRLTKQGWIQSPFRLIDFKGSL